MELEQLINLQIMMLLEISTGWFLKRRNIVTEEGKAALTGLIVNVILPCNIVHAFMVEFTPEILKNGVLVLIISILIQLICTVIGRFSYENAKREEQIVLKYGTVCSNAGFLGNPVVEGLYGTSGLLMASIYLIPLRIVMWSAGISYFTEPVSRKEVFHKVIKHPCIIAVIIGIILMITSFRCLVRLIKRFPVSAIVIRL